MQKELGDYVLVTEIGKGQFGVVYKAVKKQTKQEFAIKVMKKPGKGDDPRLGELLQTEIDIMMRIRQDNILPCYENIEKDGNYHLVLKYCNSGDLQGHIQKKGRLPEKDAVYYLQQLMNGFIELHRHNIMHRDFKPANVFLHNDQAIIGDFGFAKSGLELTTSKLGTPMTTAPEIQTTGNNEYYSNKIDLWSLGITFYFMLFGDYPWNVTTKPQLFEKFRTATGKYLPFPPNSSISVSEDAKDLLRRMIEADCERRIDWNDLFSHKIFQPNNEGSQVEHHDANRSVMFRGSELRTQLQFHQNRSIDKNTKLQAPVRHVIQPPAEQVPDYPLKPESDMNMQNLQSQAVDRLYHEKKVTDFIFRTVRELRDVSVLVPTQYPLAKEYITLSALILTKKMCELNATIVSALMNPAKNIYSLPQFDKFTASQQGQKILQDLLVDNDQQLEFLRKLTNDVIDKINSGSDESLQTLSLCDQPNPKLQDLDKQVTEFLSFVLFSFEQILAEIADQAQRTKFKKGLAQTYYCINHVVNFAFFGPRGTTFDWIECEQAFSTPEGLESILSEALNKCENN